MKPCSRVRAPWIYRVWVIGNLLCWLRHDDTLELRPGKNRWYCPICDKER